MSLLKNIDGNKYDIIGDVHGELNALKILMDRLGYKENGFHPEGRKLIFVGDLVDRGSDSVGVVLLVKSLVENNCAEVIIGNHELNLITNSVKDGSGWFFEERQKLDNKYEPYTKVNKDNSKIVYDFLSNIPIALSANNFNIVHATWDEKALNEIKDIPLGELASYYREKEDSIDKYIDTSGILDLYYMEQEKWKEELINKDSKVPFLENTHKYNLIHQMGNPVRILTSGVEEKAHQPFFSSGKWRFVQRNTWWDNIKLEKDVVVGHFWRKYIKEENDTHESIFKDIETASWHGINDKVFCIDYSVGARFESRNKGEDPLLNKKLSALRMPENILYFDTGEIINTNKARSRNKPK